MKRRVIISSTERKLNPWISLALSLTITGLGQVYSGNPFAGIILTLLRITGLLAAPFYSLMNSHEYMIEEISAVLFICILISLFSPLHAFFISSKRKAIFAWYNSISFYTIYSLTTISLTIAAFMIFISFFEFKIVREDTPPLFRKDDIISVKKINPGGYSRGDMVIEVTGSSQKILRVIGLPGDSISYEKGRFLSDGSELPLSIFNEDELHRMSLTDYDVISELNGKRRYPVKGNSAEKKSAVETTANQYYLAPDIRSTTGSFIITDSGNINGRVEGIFLSSGRGIFPGELSIPADSDFTGR